MEPFIDAILQIDIFFILALIAGTICGYFIGAIPGFSATMGVALFVPFSYMMNVYVAFAFLISLYCSAVFAGSIPAILIRTPGTPAAIVTILDGYEMAHKKNKAGKALGLACMSSVFGGIFSAVILIFFSRFLADAALMFGPQEYFALAILGITMIISMSHGNLLKGLISASIGLLITVIGMDAVSGFPRFTFNKVQLLGGFQDIPAMIGIFAIAEMFFTLEKGQREKKKNNENVSGIFSGFPDLVRNIPLLLKSSILGTFLGALPGAGATTASIIAYNEAKRTSKTPEEMGNGLSEGIIAPESANNAVTGGALIPLLALGIPGDSVTAILLGALMIQGLRPGPELFEKSPDVVISIYLSAVLSYVVILIISIFSIRLFSKLMNVPKNIMSAFVLVFSLIGSYALRNSYFDMYVALGFGLLGYFLRKNNFPVSPLILAMVLGRMIEEKLLVSLSLSRGNWFTFFQRPISGVLLVSAIIIVIISVRYSIKHPHMKSKNTTEKTNKMVYEEKNHE